MTRVLLLVAALLSTTASAFCSMSPPSLWNEVRAAPLIVFAHVDSVSGVRQSAVARLTVKQIWRGTTTNTIEVTASYWEACCDSRPPELRAGSDAVFFLSGSADHLVAYERSSVRYVSSDAAAEATRRLVKLTLQLQERNPNANAPPLPWIITALKHAATQPDGAAALTPPNRKPEQRQQTYDAMGLSPVMRRNLVEHFIRAPVSDRTLIDAMKLLQAHPEESLSAAFADALETVLVSEPTPEWSFEALEVFQRRFPSKRFEPRLTATDSWGATKAQLKLTPQLISREPVVVVSPPPPEADDELFPPETAAKK